MIQQTYQSALEEIDRASVSFSVASLYDPSHRRMVPTQLELKKTTTQNQQQQQASDLESLCLSISQEDAVVQSLNAMRLFAEMKLEPSSLQSIMEEIVADECRHAALSWKTLRWCVQQDKQLGSKLNESVWRSFEEKANNGMVVSDSYSLFASTRSLLSRLTHDILFGFVKSPLSQQQQQQYLQSEFRQVNESSSGSTNTDSANSVASPLDEVSESVTSDSYEVVSELIYVGCH